MGNKNTLLHFYRLLSTFDGMLSFLKARWELLVVMILFIASRIPALHYPFYWDESWSYAPGVKLMYLHGPSLMPNAIDLFYSRGHPLFFYAAAAAWMKIFGDSHVAQHAFALFISVCLLITVYEISLRVFSKKVAVISLILLPLQVLFFVQSTLLLPEVLIGLLCLLTLYFYSQNKYLFTFLCCAMLLLTKESGMVLGLVLGMHAAANLLNSKEGLTDRIKRFICMLGAGMVIGLFYLLQKKLNGWYLFPEHTGLIVWEWGGFWNKFRYALDVLFYQDMRQHLFQLLLLMAIVAAIRLKNIWYAAPLLPGCLIYAIVGEKFMWIPRKAMFVLLLAAFVFTAFQLLRLSAIKNKVKNRFVWLSMVFFIAYLLFACINFFSTRYLICALAVMLVLVAAYFQLFIAALHEAVFYLALVAIVLIGFYGFKSDTGIGDVNLGAFHAMTVQEDVVTHLERQQLYDTEIAATNFQQREHLTKPFTGFLHTAQVFRHITADTTPNTRYIIFDNIEPDGRYEQFKKDTVQFRMVFRSAKGPAWGEVYERRK